MSAPGFPLWGLIIGLAWIPTCLVWAATTVADLISATRGRRHGRMVWHAIGLPAVLTVAVCAVTFAPLRARFALSKGPMQEAADQCLAASSADEPCTIKGRLGLYRAITATTRIDDAVIIYVSGMSMMDSGFVYSPDGEPPPSSGEFEHPDYVNLGDGWFAFTASF